MFGIKELKESVDHLRVDLGSLQLSLEQIDPNEMINAIGKLEDKTKNIESNFKRSEQLLNEVKGCAATCKAALHDAEYIAEMGKIVRDAKGHMQKMVAYSQELNNQFFKINYIYKYIESQEKKVTKKEPKKTVKKAKRNSVTSSATLPPVITQSL